MKKVDILHAHLEYITAFWYILGSFGNFEVIWYIFSRFGILCQEISGNPGLAFKKSFLCLEARS
jgi:hypothetical protein